MSDSNVNIPLLRKAVEWAEAEAQKAPELCEWEQVTTVVPREELAVMGRSPECGTCYCIAGYVASVQTGLENPYDDDRVASCLDFASEQLGIAGNPEAQELFAMFNSIEDVRRIAESLAGERL